jgi:hypothetical protein
VSDLTGFLRARIAEDEAVLNLARDLSIDPPCVPGLWSGPGHHPVMSTARLAAECEAKRRILEIHGSQVQVIRWVDEDRNADDAARGHTWCTECGNVDDWPVAWPCDTLRVLATVYADHPDYRPEWRP